MRRPDNEPLLFDLPLDRPARDGDAEPVLDRQPPRAPRAQQPAKPQQTSPARSRAPQATGGAAGEPRKTAPAGAAAAAGKAATAGTSPPAPRLPLATAAAISPRLASPAPSAPSITPEQAGRAEREAWTDRAAGADRSAGSAGGAADAADAGGAPIPSDRVGIGRRAAAGAADLLVHVAVAVLALAGCRTLGVMPAVADWPAFGVFLLSFSFLYTVVPLAFWGHTLGMTWAGLTAESTGGEPLSFDQTARRWLGALLTLATAGLPLLLALSGRSLADRLSGSRTLAS
ncbi:MAG TPA: RDD family protein [Thermoanaerobaculia bacterium]|nr:RDD family protein [Thermoanaerobaculia bacterium]